MTVDDARAVLLVARQPTEWPAVPDPLSFSALLVLRQCPRRWAYSRARFEPGGLFDDGGRLQERANWAAVRGRIVHKTLQTLLEIHRRQGGPSAGSWALVRFWKQHLPPGGVPAVVAGAADEEFESLARASRNRPIMQWLRQRAAHEAGALVASVNAKLGVALMGAWVVLGAGMLQGTQRRALGLGAYPEVTVEATLQGAARARRWRGVIDVARMGETEISLVDYKGGSEQLSHREQLELYALLFARDLIVNPARRRASELMLAYDNGRTVVWPGPDDGALAALERRLTDEVEGLAREADARPPEARPAAEACGFCAARALCDGFWSRPGVVGCTRDLEGQAGGYVDLEIQVEGASGPGDELIGAPVVSTRDGLSRRVRVLVPAIQREQARSVAAQDHVRILGAQEIRPTAGDDESSDVVLALGPFAEIVRVERR